jgi:hypothetical protein
MRAPTRSVSLGFTLGALCAALAALAAPGNALGAGPAAGAGTVQGVVIAPSPKGDPTPPSEHLGFVDPPIANPIVELRQYDPFPDCFIYLEGGPAAPDANQPPKSAVVWQLESHSFVPAILPVVAGSTVEIANVGRETQLLYTPTQEDLLPKDPIGPQSSKTFAPPGSGAVRILSRSSPHLEGRVVALPTRYFSRLDHNGRFKIENVPAGRWTIRLWYRDGWASLPSRYVDVPGKDLKIDVPVDALAPAPAAQEK